MRRFAAVPPPLRLSLCLPSCLPLALAALLLPACAELRTPPPRTELPLDLVPAAQDPFRSAVRLAARDFADQAAGLNGRPAETAKAAARLEFLAQAIATDPRYSDFPPGMVMALRGAVAEVRQAIGLSETALPDQAIGALAAAARAIEAGGGSGGAFPETLFPAGPERTRQRLAEPGPLPEAAIATGRLEEAVAAMDREGGWGRRPGGLSPLGAMSTSP
ncbi:hypothetical protein [Pseudoroseomonas sp. WGS1072]|uniref:hypothetical protein n=1 Tax=Roseomonas sp. WGS1072 TaxID=3366816 RepID=UPI003BF4080E